MSGRRSLTPQEEHRLRRVVRQLCPRDRALLTVMWLTGSRVSEALSLKLGAVYRDRAVVERIGIAPRHLKGRYGTTRWMLVLPELRRALECYLGWLRQRYELNPCLPLFISRKSGADGIPQGLTRESARRILQDAFSRAHIENDGRLGTHSLRKSWAMRLYAASNYNILVVRRGLNHANVSTSQLYLDVDEALVEAAIRKCDVSRRGRREMKPSNSGMVVPFVDSAQLTQLSQG